METRLLPFLFFSTGLAGLGVSAVLIAARKYRAQNFYLSLCIFSLSVCTLYNFCYMEDILTYFPFLFVIAKSVVYLIAPSAYLYVRTILDPTHRRRPFDWLHFLPFLLVLILITNMSLRNPEAIQRALADSSVHWLFDVSNAGLYYALSVTKLTGWLFYAFLQSLCILNDERKKDRAPLLEYQRPIQWIRIFNMLLIVLFSLLLLQHVANFSIISLDFAGDITMSFILLLTLFFLICNPQILYHPGQNIRKLAVSNRRTLNYLGRSKEEKPKGIVRQLFSDQKKEEYLQALDHVLTQNRPYLHQGITVRDLSEQTGIPAHHLSNLISNEFNMHFQDFINLRRIEYLKDHIDDIEWEQLTLEGVCWQVGFTSRTTFFRAFIKFTGVSPSEYFNSVKKSREEDALQLKMGT